MGLLYYISYFAVLAAFAFVTLSLASGLLYVSELIEEHSRLAKIIGQRSIYVVMTLHVVFYFTESLPLPQTVFSIICHIVYLQNFSSTWPTISLTSVSFLASCALVIADHFLWFFYFAKKSSDARHLRTYRGVSPEVLGVTEIASFFGICVWLAPLFLFLSLSANDNALPLSTEPGSPITAAKSSNKVSLIRSIFSLLAFDSLPRFRPRPVRKDTSEGIIAPRSPNVPRSPLPHAYPSSPSPAVFGAPPRSPGHRAQELDVHLSPAPTIKLTAPPKRPTAPIRKPTGDGLGLGLRRTTPTMLMDDDDNALFSR